jgi:predicted dehydrogenase
VETAIRLGVVGYGRRGRAFLKLAARSFPGVVAAGVCDSDDARLAVARQDFPDAAAFSSFDAMLDSAALDALLVETPATLHAELCSKALAKNVHIMSDVPAAASLEEARQLWQAQQSSRAFYMLGANPNMWGFVEAAVDLVKEGALGKPYYMEAEYIHDIRGLFDATPWRRHYESIRYCTHSLGPLLRLIDEDLEWVSCFDTGSHVNQEPGQHDAMVAIFRTASGVVVRLLTCFVNNYPACVHGYRVYGTKGYFERRPPCEGAGLAKTFYYSVARHEKKALYEIQETEAPRGLDANAAASGHGGADYALLQRFFGAIRGGSPSPISLREGLRMTIPGIVAAESARCGGALTRIWYPWSRP